MVNEEVIMKLTEAIELLDNEMESLSDQLANKENEIKAEKLKAVDAIDNAFAAYKGNPSIPDEAWDKLNALRGMYEGLVQKEKYLEEVEKVEHQDRINDLENKKNGILEALKPFGKTDSSVSYSAPTETPALNGLLNDYQETPAVEETPVEEEDDDDAEEVEIEIPEETTEE